VTDGSPTRAAKIGPTAQPAPADVLVIGFGNPLAGDDGAGPAVIDALRRAGLPAGARAEHGGSDALCLRTLWRGERDVWLADAVAAGRVPGTVMRLGHEDLLAAPQRHASVHRLSLPECLRWLSLAFPELSRVQYRFWGVQVERVCPEAGLSPSVDAGARTVAAEIRSALTRLRVGCHTTAWQECTRAGSGGR
jgi:hydrogenase maturation protease